MNVKFYVLIPVYQAEKYLEECINSVVNQTYTNYSIILVDDGSTDQSGVICDKIKQRYNNIYVIHQSNSGQLASRLRAVDAAKKIHLSSDDLGYLVFLDADDMIAIDTLAYLAWIINTKPADCIVMDWIRFNSIQSLPRVSVKKEEMLECMEYITEKNQIYGRLLTDNSYNSMCRKVVKIDKVSTKDYSEMYHIRNGEDLIQSLEIYKKIETLILTNTGFYFYRQNPESVTHKRPDLANATDFSVRKIVLEFLDQSGVFDECDYMEYYKYCKNLILGEILIFINSGMSFVDTQKLIKCISIDEYYYRVTKNGNNFVCTKSIKTLMFNLLMNKISRNITIRLLMLVSRIKRR